MKKIGIFINKFFNVIEIYIPMLAFIVMFLSFIIVIAYRYIFYASIKEIYELSIIMFLWSSIIAASYGSRSEEHVIFTILYNKVSERIKLIFRLCGNLLIIITFLILIPYAYESVSFMAIKKSSVLGISFSIIYCPFVLFVIFTPIHHIVLFFRDIRQSKAIWKGKNEI